MVVDTGVEDGGTEVGVLVGLVGADEDPGGTDAPEPMEVVMGPSSMYTPEMYQSSG